MRSSKILSGLRLSYQEPVLAISVNQTVAKTYEYMYQTSRRIGLISYLIGPSDSLFKLRTNERLVSQKGNVTTPI
jgi:hypothetical protein